MEPMPSPFIRSWRESRFASSDSAYSRIGPSRSSRFSRTRSTVPRWRASSSMRGLVSASIWRLISSISSSCARKYEESRWSRGEAILAPGSRPSPAAGMYGWTALAVVAPRLPVMRIRIVLPPAQTRAGNDVGRTARSFAA